MNAICLPSGLHEPSVGYAIVLRAASPLLYMAPEISSLANLRVSYAVYAGTVKCTVRQPVRFSTDPHRHPARSNCHSPVGNLPVVPERYLQFSPFPPNSHLYTSATHPALGRTDAQQQVMFVHYPKAVGIGGFVPFRLPWPDAGR